VSLHALDPDCSFQNPDFKDSISSLFSQSFCKGKTECVLDLSEANFNWPEEC
jgi:hypothetical protein